LSLGDWYLALFSIGVGVSLPSYWLFIEKTDPFHLASETLTGLVLLAAGIAMLAADEDAGWVIALSAIGMGMLAYALIDSPGRYRGDRKKQALFAVGWVFLLPAVVIRFTTL
jgi:hypothetical protein